MSPRDSRNTGCEVLMLERTLQQCLRSATIRRGTVERVFVYIPHDPCPPSTIAFSRVRRAGPTTSRSNSRATLKLRALPTPSFAEWQNPAGDGSRKTDLYLDRDWPSWRITTRAGWLPT